jgi:hypothetical protein
MGTPPSLNIAIQGLYEAFSRYPLRQFTDPCLHCHTLEDEAQLHLLPLRQLGAAELRKFAEDALLVWGEVSDFKHFLPRVFELYFDLENPAFEFTDPEILFSKFRHGDWLTWPAPEQNAVRTFLHAVWAEVLTDPPPIESFTDVQSWLCSIAQAEDDLKPYLVQWTEDPSESSSLALSWMLLSDAGRSPFWDRRDDQYDQVQQWKKSPPVAEKLMQSRDLAASETVKNEFEAALGCIGLNLP